MPASERSKIPTAPGAPHIAVARQAILNHERAIFGYEFFDRSVQADQHTGATDAQMLFKLHSSSDTDAISSKTLFINCTHASLAGGHLDLVAPERVVLEIPPLPVTEVDQIQNHLTSLQGMQRRSFRLAFDYSVLTRPYESWLALDSFIKFDLSDQVNWAHLQALAWSETLAT